MKPPSQILARHSSLMAPLETFLWRNINLAPIWIWLFREPSRQPRFIAGSLDFHRFFSTRSINFAAAQWPIINVKPAWDFGLSVIHHFVQIRNQQGIRETLLTFWFLIIAMLTIPILFLPKLGPDKTFSISFEPCFLNICQHSELRIVSSGSRMLEEPWEVNAMQSEEY